MMFWKKNVWTILKKGIQHLVYTNFTKHVHNQGPNYLLLLLHWTQNINGSFALSGCLKRIFSWRKDPAYVKDVGKLTHLDNASRKCSIKNGDLPSKKKMIGPQILMFWIPLSLFVSMKEKQNIFWFFVFRKYTQTSI